MSTKAGAVPTSRGAQQRQGIPLIINGPSVSSPSPDPKTRQLLHEVTERASYVAFRDEVSCDAVDLSECHVIPDTALEVARLWSNEELDRSVASVGLGSEPTFVVHMKQKYCQDASEAAEAVDALARQIDARPVLIAIGECHGDDQVHTRVAQLMKSNPACLLPRSLVDVASNIHHSRAYIGSSMHGYITAVAFGTPALLVLNSTPHHKFLGLLSQLGMDRAKAVAPNWRAATKQSPRRVESSNRQAVFRSLDAHWASVGEALQFEVRTDDSFALRHWKRQVVTRQLAASGKRRLRSTLSRAKVAIRD